MRAATDSNPTTRGSTLQVYLLGAVDFEATLGLQRRLVYEVAGDPSQAALLMCEHPPLITVGRQGSWSHVLASPEELRARRLRLRWVNRGGGCLLHLAGQLAVYPILPLARLGLGLREYLHMLQETVRSVLGDFDVVADKRADPSGVWTKGRLVAATGVAVRDWVTYYGTVLNVNPALEPFRLIRCDPLGGRPVTSLERERRVPVRPSLVRERFLHHFVGGFGFGRTALFSDHPTLRRQVSPDALATHA